MALFPHTGRQYVNPDSHRRHDRTTPARVRRHTEQEPSGLPNFMRRLDLLCRQTGVHQLPVRMKYIAEALSDRGRATAIYACPHAGCAWREGWVVDDRGHGCKPFRLWAGFHRR